jgi:cytochrome c oxidase subunit IV
MKTSNHWRPPRILLFSWLALLGLLALTVSIAYLPIGTFNTPVALSIALVKGLIVAAIFMELRDDRTLALAAAVAGFYWLAILLWLSFADFLTRPNFPPGGVSIF